MSNVNSLYRNLTILISSVCFLFFLFAFFNFFTREYIFFLLEMYCKSEYSPSHICC